MSQYEYPTEVWCLSLFLKVDVLPLVQLSLHVVTNQAIKVILMVLPCRDCHGVGFFGLMTIELLSHQDETWSKLSCKVCSTSIISFPDVWSVVSTSNMSQAIEMFGTCSGRSLIKMLNRIGPRTDPSGTPNFTEPSEE